MYLASELGLSRPRLALLAMLLGSDYTEGIAGIGIVNAMETLHAFPDLEALRAFKAWMDSPDYERFEPVGKRLTRAQQRGAGGHRCGGSVVPCRKMRCCCAQANRLHSTRPVFGHAPR